MWASGPFSVLQVNGFRFTHHGQYLTVDLRAPAQMLKKHQNMEGLVATSIGEHLSGEHWQSSHKSLSTKKFKLEVEKNETCQKNSKSVMSQIIVKKN